MIKPEFWDDEKLSQISRDARLTYIGLWNHSDDYGVVKGAATWLYSRIYPYDGGILTEFKKWLQELERIHRIIPFRISREQFYYIPTFLIHQTINKPSKYNRNPPVPQSLLNTLPEGSSSTTAPLPPEGKGREVKGSKGNKEGKNPPFFKIDKKQQADINRLTKILQPQFENIIHFRNEKLNIGVNPDAMIHAFKRAIKKQTFDDVRGGIESYIAKIIIIEDGNFNAAKHEAEHQTRMDEKDIQPRLKNVIKNIGGKA